MADNYYGITDTGKVRSNNEDTFIAASHGSEIIACVIDGVGGYSGGEIASELARQAIEDHLQIGTTDKKNVVKDALLSANNLVYNERLKSDKNNQMACVVTLALADITNNKLYFAHVGDTRMYLYRDRSLVKITHDHSFVGFLEESGRLSESEAMNHAKRNEINKALGFTATITDDDYIESGESPFLPGDVILLCSDGLSDLVTSQAIVDIFQNTSSLKKQASLLIDAANNAGGKDNITVVLVKNDKELTQHTATRPVAAVQTKAEPIKTETITTEYKAPAEPIRERPKSSSAVPVLSILLLLLLAAFIWLFYQYYNNRRTDRQITEGITPTEVKRSANELRLIDSINNNTNNEVFMLNTPGDQPVLISDTIHINSDSLHIIGNGATLAGNGLFKGPAFVINPSAKYILLDSLTLKDFDVALLVHNNSLHFKNVVFSNCRIPVQYNFNYPDSLPVNGQLVDTMYNIFEHMTIKPE